MCYDFRLHPLTPPRRKERKSRGGDVKQRMKPGKGLRIIASVVTMEASWYCVTENLVPKHTISLVLVW